jgi:hypothetical protein
VVDCSTAVWASVPAHLSCGVTVCLSICVMRGTSSGNRKHAPAMLPATRVKRSGSRKVMVYSLTRNVESRATAGSRRESRLVGKQQRQRRFAPAAISWLIPYNFYCIAKENARQITPAACPTGTLTTVPATHPQEENGLVPICPFEWATTNKLLITL